MCKHVGEPGGPSPLRLPACFAPSRSPFSACPLHPLSSGLPGRCLLLSLLCSVVTVGPSWAFLLQCILLPLYQDSPSRALTPILLASCTRVVHVLVHECHLGLRCEACSQGSRPHCQSGTKSVTLPGLALAASVHAFSRVSVAALP